MCEYKNKVESRYKKGRISFILIAIYSGICSIAEIEVKYYFKETKKLNAESLDWYTSLLSKPYKIKSLLGLLIDNFKICDSSHKYYLYLCFLINGISWIIFIIFKNGEFIIPIISQILINLSLSFTIVIGTHLKFELCRMYDRFKYDENKKGEKNKELTSEYFIFSNLATLISYFLHYFLIEKLSNDFIFYMCGLFSLLILASGLIVKETKFKNKYNNEIICSSFNGEEKKEDEEKDENENNEINKEICCANFCLKYGLQFCHKFLLFRKELISLLILIFIMEILPSNLTTLFFYESNFLGFTQKDISLIVLFSKSFTVFINCIFKYEKNLGCVIFFVKVFMFLNYSLIFLLVTQKTQKYINNYFLIIIISCLNEGLYSLWQRSYNFLAIQNSYEFFQNFCCLFVCDITQIFARQIEYFLTSYFNVTNSNFENFGIIIFIEIILILIQLLYIYIYI